MHSDLSECNSSGPEIHQSDIDTRLEQAIVKIVAGFDTGMVKGYVVTLTERRVQRRFRDPHGNQAFWKVVFHQTDDVGVLLCESDDVVLEYSCDPCSEYDCLFWFDKQEERHMPTEECLNLD